MKQGLLPFIIAFIIVFICSFVFFYGLKIVRSRQVYTFPAQDQRPEGDLIGVSPLHGTKDGSGNIMIGYHTLSSHPLPPEFLEKLHE